MDVKNWRETVQKAREVRDDPNRPEGTRRAVAEALEKFEASRDSLLELSEGWDCDE